MLPWKEPLAVRITDAVINALIGSPVRAIAWSLLVVGAIAQLVGLSGLTRLAVAAAVVATIAAARWWYRQPVRWRR